MNQRSKGTMLSYLYMIIHIFINLLYVPLLLRYIGQSEYGLYQIVGSIMAYFTVMESSLSAGVLRYYCKYKAMNDREGMENILAISKKIYNWLSIIVCLLGIIGIFGISIFYKNSFSAEELLESKIMFIILMGNLIVTLRNYVYVAVINGNEEFVFIKLLGIISMIVQPVMVVLAIKKMPYAVVIVMVQFIINCIVAFLRKKYVIKKIGAKIVLHQLDWRFVKEISFFSIQILAASLADQIFWKTDQVIIGNIYGTVKASIYAVGAQIYMNYMPIGTAISGVFMPYVSRLYQNENRDYVISALFAKVGRIACFMLLMVLTGFILLGKEFLHLWVGDGYETSYYVAVIVMIPFTVDLMQNLGLTILQVYNKYLFRSKIYFVIAVINIALTVALIKRYGIVGAATATAVSMIIGNIIIMNIYYFKIGIDIRLFWKSVFPFTVCALISFLAGRFILPLHLDNAYMEFTVHGILYIGLYIGITYFGAFNDYEKGLLKRLISKRWGGVNCVK